MSDQPGRDVVDRASSGAWLLTVRGAGMRAVSLLSNLALVALVTPADIGLLAVVRGIAGLSGNSSDLGFAWALLRRPEPPTDAEYGALAGLQFVLIAACVAVAFCFPSLLATIPGAWHGATLLVLLALLTLPLGTGARLRIERALDYRRIAFSDVTSVLLQNAVLLVSAVTGHFAAGVFVATGGTVLYVNLLLWWWSPGPRPLFRPRIWRRLAGEFAGFTLAHGGTMLNTSGTPLLVAALFGLPAAGIWSVATRLGNVLQMAFEGYRRAAIPAAAHLVRARDHLAALVNEALAGAARLTIPMIVVLVAVVPEGAHLLPRWSAAVLVAQLYVIGSGLTGILGTAVVPVAVALRGARIVLAEQFSTIVIGWAGFVVLALLHGHQLAWVVLPMFAARWVAMWRIGDAAAWLQWTPALRRLAMLLVGMVALMAAARVTRTPPLISAIPVVALAAIVLAVPPIRRWTRTLRAGTWVGEVPRP